MVKIFLGDYQTVEKDINSWIEVYRPDVRDIKQSMALMESEHRVLVLITLLYEPTQPDTRVQYSVQRG